MEQGSDSIVGINQSSDSSVQAYLAYYSKLANQQNMLSDYIRTSTYFNAITSNPDDFKGKVVLDVGTGTGILAIFSAKAGAKRVYAVEASNAIKYAQIIVKQNKLEETITLIQSKIEDVKNNQIEPIDVIVSEPLGTMLVNERMIESVLYARDKFLSKTGKIYPGSATLFFMPFSDEKLYNEQMSKISFWFNNNFFGVDMTALYQSAYIEKLSQPVIDAYDPSLHVCNDAVKYSLDFTSISCDELKRFTVDFEFEINKNCTVHGIAGWFDVLFNGINNKVSLSTSPYCPFTHWYQTRLLFLYPINIEKGKCIIGSIEFVSNNDQSYNIKLKVKVKDKEDSYQSNSFNLREPDFRGITYNNYYSQTTTNPSNQ